MGFPYNPATTVFLRAFRWTVTPFGYDGVEQFMKTVEYDLFAKTIYIEAYDVAGGRVIDWLRFNPTATLKAAFYDGCGNLMETLDFVVKEPVQHRATMDYASSDVLTHRATFRFSDVQRTRYWPEEPEKVTASPLDSTAAPPDSGTSSTPDAESSSPPSRPRRRRTRS